MGQQSSKLLTLPLQKLFYRAVITAGHIFISVYSSKL